MMSSVLNGNSEKVTGGYLMPNSSLYYMILDQKSVNKNRQYIINMEANKKITVAQDATLDADGTDGTDENPTATETTGSSSTSKTTTSSTTSTATN